MKITLTKKIRLEIDYQINIENDESTLKQIEDAEENITKAANNATVKNGKVVKVVKK